MRERRKRSRACWTPSNEDTKTHEPVSEFRQKQRHDRRHRHDRRQKRHRFWKMKK